MKYYKRLGKFIKLAKEMYDFEREYIRDTKCVMSLHKDMKDGTKLMIVIGVGTPVDFIDDLKTIVKRNERN